MSPKCEICGKDLANPNSSGHINSKFHQDALKQTPNIAEVTEDMVDDLSEVMNPQNIEIKKSGVRVTKPATKPTMPITPSPTANPVSDEDYKKVIKKGLRSKIKKFFKK